MTDSEIADRLSYLEKKVLLALRELRSASPEEILARSGLEKLVEVMNASSWLQAKDLVSIEEKVTRRYSLGDREGALRPLPEKVVLKKVISDHSGKASMAELSAAGLLRQQDLQIALGWIRKKGWGTLSKDQGGTIIEATDAGRAAVDSKGEDEILIERLSEGDLHESEVDSQVIRQLKQRKDFLNERLVTERRISLTEQGSRIAALDLDTTEEVGQLTPDLIA